MLLAFNTSTSFAEQILTKKTVKRVFAEGEAQGGF